MIFTTVRNVLPLKKFKRKTPRDVPVRVRQVVVAVARRQTRIARAVVQVAEQ